MDDIMGHIAELLPPEVPRKVSGKGPLVDTKNSKGGGDRLLLRREKGSEATRRSGGKIRGHREPDRSCAQPARARKTSGKSA